jgi:hypothetical protein
MRVYDATLLELTFSKVLPSGQERLSRSQTRKRCTDQVQRFLVTSYQLRTGNGIPFV